MNKPVIAGIAAGVLLAGMMLGSIPGFFFGAQAQEQQNTAATPKKVFLIADEVDVQIAPDNPLHPGGVTYRAMVFKDRKSTRLNSSHANISYAVFCLKKKKLLNYIMYHNN